MYCSYASICQFDPVLGGNSYRIISDKEDSEVWNMIGANPTEASGRQEGDKA